MKYSNSSNGQTKRSRFCIEDLLQVVKKIFVRGLAISMPALRREGVGSKKQDLCRREKGLLRSRPVKLKRSKRAQWTVGDRIYLTIYEV